MSIFGKAKSFIQKTSSSIKNKAIAAATAATTIGTMAISTFASGDPEIAITAEMLAPLKTYTIANLAVILPVGIGLMCVLIGIPLIPRTIKRFLHV